MARYAHAGDLDALCDDFPDDVLASTLGALDHDALWAHSLTDRA